MKEDTPQEIALYIVESHLRSATHNDRVADDKILKELITNAIRSERGWRVTACVSGEECAMLRKSMLQTFKTRVRLDMFFQDNGFSPLNHHAHESQDVEDQLFELIGHYNRLGWLPRLIEAYNQRRSE